ncbi:hypothetical protein C3F09_04880 [candidate division GN15 bacterium]|uniref:ABC transporter permease n=1 Tax=candidate division GN15 bacterium TaxID=2072418 RepID=A0A855X8J9_9BACT|nr:MAG: hypothetical protein C3F09_04880 [candidate division GN15 bacterium]
MTFRDLVAISAGNLSRMKLRTFLTVSGVVIAIGTFVAMVSFGAGNQKYISEQYEELGLFSTLQVHRLSKTAAGDSTQARPLDQQALNELSKIPGVRLAYPFDAMTVTAALADSQLSAKAQALPLSAMQTRLFSQFRAGHSFSSDSAKEVVVTPQLLHLFGLTHPDSLIGDTMVISIRVATIDSGLAGLIPRDSGWIRQQVRAIQFDSLLQSAYRQRQAKRLTNEAISRFVNGFFEHRAIVKETLTVVGVLEERGAGRTRMEPIVLPVAIAAKFRSSGLSDDPSALFTAFSQGTVFSLDSAASSRSYPQITLDIDPNVPLKAISDSVRAMGFEPFSFAQMFEEMQKFFFYFNLALSVVGLIALVTASLGIVNTMVMSILERRREIGVLKSLGADDRHIRILFLVESGVIGAVGSVVGILVGWGVTRIASVIIKQFMMKSGVGPIELFALPLWLILTAVAVGIVVSVAAGYYPASRAAKVDPVEALRNE